MIRIIENQARNDQIQNHVNCRNTMAKALGEIRGVGRIFPEVRTFFQISLSTLSPAPNLTSRSTYIDVISSPLSTAKIGLGENDMFTFYTVPLAI